MNVRFVKKERDKVKKNKSTVEKYFDKKFIRKKNIGYKLNFDKFGIKDKRIAWTLLDFGIEGKRCLDIGPGTGRWLNYLKSNGARYLAGVDISNESLKCCKGLCDKTQKLNLEFEKIDYEENFFDIVISFEVMEHLRNPINYITEIKRVVKRGGLIMISLPNLISLISRVRMMVGLSPVCVASDKTHVQHYRPVDIIRIFNSIGMKPKLMPNTISLHPWKQKSRFAIRSSKEFVSFNDTILAKIIYS